MTANRRFQTVLVCMMVIGATCVVAQDWPQWRGAERDGKVKGFTTPGQWPEKLTQTWKETVGTGCATPALVGDKLYVFARQGTDEVTLCLNATTGKEVWKDSYAAQKVTGAAGRHPGPRSSCAVAAGKVVTLGVGGVLSCLDVATGKMVWRKDPFPKVVPKFFTSCSPIIADGLVIAQLGTAGNGAVMAYDLASGSETWRWSEEGPDYASPAVLTVGGSKQVVTLTEKSIVGISLADGKLLWKQPFPVARRAYNAATPIVQGQTVIYMGAGRGAKAVKIEKQGGSYVVKELWSNPDLAPQYNTPVLVGGYLYGLTDGGSLFCINAENGSTAWVDSAKHGRGFAAIVSAGSSVLALPSTSELIVYQPDSQKYSEIKRYKVSDTATYAYPVVAGNRIYIKDQESLALLSIN
jgi:outer membrane protein assembly factor BamB